MGDPQDVLENGGFIRNEDIPGEQTMPTLVPGGAIEKLCQKDNLTPTSDEAYIVSDQIAIAATDKGLAVYVKDQGDARLLPFA